MKKFIKSLLAIVLVFVIFGAVGCTLRTTKTIECNGLIYRWYKETNIYHLTGDQMAKNPEIMHISPYCNGNEVKYYGVTFRGTTMESGGRLISYAPSLINVKELSIPYCMERYEGLRDDAMYGAPQKIIIVRNSNSDEGFISLHIEYYEDESYMREFYCSSINYEARVQNWIENLNSRGWTGETYENQDGECYFYYSTFYENDCRFKLCKANTAYMFNYENCPNDGYFFIYDFEYGDMIENTPYEPIRDGYKFDGWYKEPECINAWNFETDKLPNAQYNDEGQEIYQETKLYAKWIKKWW